MNVIVRQPLQVVAWVACCDAVKASKASTPSVDQIFADE